MVKYKPLKESFFKETFSYFVTPLLNFSRFSETKWSHSYQAEVASKNLSSYFNKVILEAKSRQLFRQLEQLFLTSQQDLEEQKKDRNLPANIHPIEEKNWLINSLKPRIVNFGANEIWQVMLCYRRRELYYRYLSCKKRVDQFEIFLENYFFSAISQPLLVEVFLMAYEGEEAEREEKVSQFLNCLPCQQTNSLLIALKKTTIESASWEIYCLQLLKSMRNAQIKQAFCFFPGSLKESALCQLYPYEVVEVVEQLQDANQREQLIETIFKNCRNWWQGFSFDEVKQAQALLRDL